MIMDQMLLLWKLQSCETSLEEVNEKKNLATMERKIKKMKIDHCNLRNNLKKLIREYKDIENILMKNNHQCKNLYFQLKEIEKEIYDGSVNDLKIYQKREKEINLLKETIQSVEDQSLEKMIRKEEIQKEILKNKKVLKSVEKIYKESKEIYDEEIKNIENQQKELQGNIEKLQEKIEKPFLDIYKNLKKDIKPILVKVDRETCTGCNMGISIIRLKNIQQNETIYTCENCGRILYVEDIS